MEQTLDISLKTIIKVLVTGFVLFALFLIRDIVIWFFFALVISLLFEPAINFLRRLRLPKILAVILIYLSIFGALGLMIYLTAPIFVAEISQFSKNVPDYFEKISPLLEGFGIDVSRNFEDFSTSMASLLRESSGSIVKAISVFFGGVVSTLVIFVFAFYISMEDKGPEKFLTFLVPKKYEEYVLNIFAKSQFKVAGWFGARILACLFVGIASLIIFLLLGVKYALTMALVSGVLTFVPFIGPLITAILVLLSVGVSDSWLLAIYLVVVLAIVQSIENNIVTPLLMKKFINLPPILVLMSLLAGGTILGFLGMIFVVPVFGIVYEFLREFLEERKAKQF